MSDFLLIVVLVLIAVLWYVIISKYESFMRRNYRGRKRFKNL